jgi:hypothetical protein
MEHEFSDADDRCIHCGTLKEHHERTPQPCPYRAAPSDLRPEPSLRVPAADDSDTISARIKELRAEREAAWASSEEEPNEERDLNISDGLPGPAG